MKNKRNFPFVTVTKKAEASIKRGHPWVYDAEIIQAVGEFENGCLVDVLSLKGSYLGTGFLSEKSKIRIRILSSNANEAFSPAFWERRLKYAVDYRKTVMGSDFSCCRLIFGEADGLPGLTVDRFSDILVAQVLSYGMDKIKKIPAKNVKRIGNGVFFSLTGHVLEYESKECKDERKNIKKYLK